MRERQEKRKLRTSERMNNSAKKQKKEPKKYHCELCQTKLPYKTIILHLKNIHKDNAYSLVCLILCDIITTHAWLLSARMSALKDSKDHWIFKWFDWWFHTVTINGDQMSFNHLSSFNYNCLIHLQAFTNSNLAGLD